MSLTINQQIGRNIKKALKKRGMFQTQLHELLDVPYPTLNSWINGKGNIPNEQVQEIERILNLKPGELNARTPTNWSDLTLEEDRKEAEQLIQRLEELGVYSYRNDPRNIHDKLTDIRHQDLPHYRHDNKKMIDDLLAILIRHTRPY